MWTCSMLKNNAREALRGRYWRSFWGCFIVSLLGGGSYVNWSWMVSSDWIEEYLNTLPLYALLTLLVWLLIAIVIAALWDIFLVSPLMVGRCRYFMESRQSPTPISTLFSVFQTPYLNVVKVSFLTSLKISVGLLLFVVPGIY